MAPSREDAARTIEHYAARYLFVKHGGSKFIAAWPSLTEVKLYFIDAKALAAGAADGEFYTNDMLLARERLKSDIRVVTSLRHAWQRLAPHGAERLTLTDYTSMTRVLYLALKLQADEYDFDPEDCMESLHDDWEHDAGGKDHLTYDDFAHSFFELADLNTEHVDALEYANWIDALVAKISSPSGGFQNDLEIIDEIQEEMDLDDDEFLERRSAWANFFADLSGGKGADGGAAGDSDEARGSRRGRDTSADGADSSASAGAGASGAGRSSRRAASDDDDMGDCAGARDSTASNGERWRKKAKAKKKLPQRKQSVAPQRRDATRRISVARTIATAMQTNSAFKAVAQRHSNAPARRSTFNVPPPIHALVEEDEHDDGESSAEGEAGWLIKRADDRAPLIALDGDRDSRFVNAEHWRIAGASRMGLREPGGLGMSSDDDGVAGAYVVGGRPSWRPPGERPWESAGVMHCGGGGGDTREQMSPWMPPGFPGDLSELQLDVAGYDPTPAPAPAPALSEPSCGSGRLPAPPAPPSPPAVASLARAGSPLIWEALGMELGMDSVPRAANKRLPQLSQPNVYIRPQSLPSTPRETAAAALPRPSPRAPHSPAPRQLPPISPVARPPRTHPERIRSRSPRHARPLRYGLPSKAHLHASPPLGRTHGPSVDRVARSVGASPRRSPAAHGDPSAVGRTPLAVPNGLPSPPPKTYFGPAALDATADDADANCHVLSFQFGGRYRPPQHLHENAALAYVSRARTAAAASRPRPRALSRELPPAAADPIQIDYDLRIKPLQAERSASPIERQPPALASWTPRGLLQRRPHPSSAAE